MKKLNFLFICLVATIGLFVASCNKSNDEPKPPVEIVEDGFYLSGEATSSTELKTENMMSVGINEQGQVVRAKMREKYVALEAGKTFTITEVRGSDRTVYGADMQVEEPFSDDNEPAIQLQRGTFAENGKAFQVAESGLYHVIMEDSLKTVVIAPVELGIRGGMNGWGFTAFDKPAFDKNSMTYKIENVDITTATAFKFAYGGGWKLRLDPDGTVQANTNLGNNNLENAPIMGDNLIQGGKDIALERGIYTIELTWKLNDGDLGNSFVGSVTKTGETAAPEYPENLYINGGDFGGETWDWTSADIVTMNPVHSHPHAFWAIVYVSANGEFKFSPEKAWQGDFGVSGEATDGVYSKGSDNVKVVDAGYYMVYVDLKANKVSVTAPEVYLIGSTINDVWDYAATAGKFTVDNAAKKITSPAFQAAGELRMYATCPLSQLDDPVADWWQMEFIVLDGNIVYRGTGDDQTRVNVTAGQKVVLDFQAGTGTIQ